MTTNSDYFNTIQNTVIIISKNSLALVFRENSISSPLCIGWEIYKTIPNLQNIVLEITINIIWYSKVYKTQRVNAQYLIKVK